MTTFIFEKKLKPLKQCGVDSVSTSHGEGFNSLPHVGDRAASLLCFSGGRLEQTNRQILLHLV